MIQNNTHQSEQLLVKESIPNDELVKKLNSNEVKIKLAQWAQLDENVKKIQAWKCKQLYLDNLKDTKTIQKIKDISFPILIKLQLSFNGLESIESLSTMYLPCLRTIHIDYNRIRCIKPLRKIISQELQTFSLYDNPFLDFYSFSELKLSEIIKWIHLQSYGSEEVFGDVRWLIKLQGKSLYYLQMECDERIVQERAICALEKKYGQIGISRKK